MAQMIVRDLCQLCLEEIKKGNGEKKILISDDNEGNGYHGLFYGFTQITEEDKEYYVDSMYDTQEKDINKILILG